MGLFLAVSILPLALLAGATVFVTQQNSLDEAHSKLRASTTAGSAFVDQQLGGLTDVLDSFAKSASLVAALGTGSPASYDQPRVATTLDQLRQARGDIAYGFLADPLGVLRGISPLDPSVVGADFSYRDWYRGALIAHGPYVSVAYKSAVGTKPLVIAAAVKVVSPQGITLGVLAATYTLATLQSYVADVARAQSVNLLVTDQAGTVVAQPSGEPGSIRSLATDARIRAALSGGAGVIDSYEAGIPILSAYGFSSTTHWAVLASVPRSEALGSATRLSAIVLSLAAIVGLAVMGALVLLYRALRAAETAVAERQSAEARFQAVFNSSGLGICTVSRTGELLQVNPNLERMLGFEPGRLASHNFSDVTHPDDVERTREVYRRVGNRGVTALSIEKRYITSGGAVFWGNMTVSAVRQASEEVDYFVAIVEDIDGRRRASELLEKLNRDKSHFVSLVSHEFRTALTGIQGFSELLRDSEGLSAAEIHDYANDINADAQRLARMINELLDLERMESGKTTLTRTSVDLVGIVRAAVSRLGASSPGHDFEVLVDPLVRAVAGDGDKLTQVVTNLLSNAVKYSPDGGVVQVSIAAGQGGAEVSISDTGLGIPAEHIDRIFERYARIESANTRYIAGTGLGLPIVKQIVEMHQGTVSVTSVPGEGSTFRFTIPWA